MSVKITFLGAAGTVTGSKYLVEGGGKRILVDVGLFQGERQWRERNWENPPIDLSRIDAVLITHAHIDHIGLLPRYVKLGLSCPVYCTASTASLIPLMLLDSARLQEEEARWRQQSGRSRHHPPLPLYTEEDAEKSLSFLRRVDFGSSVKLFDGTEARWSHMGHIIGAAAINLEVAGKNITFSGDIGRYGVPILRDPEPLEIGDLLLIESTYGDRLHSDLSPKNELARIVNEAYSRNGVVLIPAFALGRTQLLLFYLRELKEARRIPDIPIIIDSPMASDATSIYQQFPGDYDEAALKILQEGRRPFITSKVYFTRDRAESKKLNEIDEPMIIIAGSGTLSGGRILHHLKQRISSPLNTLLFVGYQPQGGRGDWIKGGAKSLRLLGEELSIRAKVEEISGLSAHADRNELLRWCGECRGRPSKVKVVHGEPESASSFCSILQNQKKWDVAVARYMEEYVL